MGAFANLDELVNRMTGGGSGNVQPLFLHKEPRVAGALAASSVATQFTSLWEYEGTPSHGVPPTTAAVCTNATPGALGQTDPSGGRQLWLAASGAGGNINGTLVMYDRLAHIGGLSGTVVTAQAAALTPNRYTSGRGNSIFLEIYSAVGVTGTTVTVSYVNQAGATKTSQPKPFGGTNLREAQRFMEVALAAGDTGVQSIISVTVLVTTGTAGNFGVVLGHKLEVWTHNASYQLDQQALVDGTFPEVLPGACLAFCDAPTGGGQSPYDVTTIFVER